MRRWTRPAILIGSAWLASPALAQHAGAMPTVGFLSSRSPQEAASLAAAFQQGLKESGYIDGQNVRLVFRWAEGDYARLPAMAAALAKEGTAVIVPVGGEVTVRAAKAVTSTIPIVFVIGSDAVEMGLVESLNRPEGNITGATLMGGALGAKRLQLLRELVPQAAVIGFLVNPDHPRAAADTTEVRDAASAFAQDLRIVTARNEPDLESAFETLAQATAGALIVNRDGFLNSRREQIMRLARRHAMPAIYESREHVAAGGLVSYGTSYSETYRHIGRILKGAKPADLPVLQPTRFELVINLKTAKDLGLEVPPSLLVRADEVIE